MIIVEFKNIIYMSYIYLTITNSTPTLVASIVVLALTDARCHLRQTLSLVPTRIEHSC